ncbi:MAG: isocitrate lyase/PEP mutase family protein [Oscillospiraceae bacterium]|nr:isocitrate lyase/PEP mutase family protein [Oscillospiraceae bacterium]
MIKNPGLVLREMLNAPGIVIAPGVYDGISARTVELAGFKTAYMTGAGVSASVIGQADIGLTTMTEMVTTAKNIAQVLNIPLICDADTGYGNPLNTIRTVHEYEMAGVAAIQLEDQRAPKRCGHLGGKVLVSADEFTQKVKAAATEKYFKETVIVARTDSRAVEGFDSAVERCKRYIDAGADLLFFEAPQSRDEIEQVGKLFGHQIPLLSNQVYGGKTPSLTAEELQQLGYKIVIFPSTLGYAACIYLRQVADRLMELGTDAGVIEGGMNAMDMFNIMGIQQWNTLEQNYKY